MLSKMKTRYKIEAKNSELKNQYGYDIASSSGLNSMKMQVHRHSFLLKWGNPCINPQNLFKIKR